jgi:hypothetical protein
MRVNDIDTANRHQVEAFLDLPFRLYRDVPQWVPPLRHEARLMLDRKRHPFFRHSQAAFLLVEGPAGQTIGRVAILDNRNFNDFNQEHTAFFFLFECEDNREAALALFEAGFAWARARGLKRIYGPKGMTPFDGLGMLVRGFDHRPAFGIPYNPPYYPALVEAAGFRTSGEIVSGYLGGSYRLPQRVHQVAEAVQRRRGLRVVRYRSRRDLRALVPQLQHLYNNALGGTPGGVPLNDEEVGALASQLLWFADPRLIKIVMKDDQPVGFLFAYPDVSAAVQRSRGRLFPFGWLDLLLELRRTKWININGAGIIEKYRGLGGTALLFSELEKSVHEGGFAHADLVQVGMENDKMQRELADLGIDFYKMHRMYEREL